LLLLLSDALEVLLGLEKVLGIMELDVTLIFFVLLEKMREIEFIRINIIIIIICFDEIRHLGIFLIDIQ
jgi:hypothetical protein